MSRMSMTLVQKCFRMSFSYCILKARLHCLSRNGVVKLGVGRWTMWKCCRFFFLCVNAKESTRISPSEQTNARVEFFFYFRYSFFGRFFSNSTLTTEYVLFCKKRAAFAWHNHFCYNKFSCKRQRECRNSFFVLKRKFVFNIFRIVTTTTTNVIRVSKSEMDEWLEWSSSFRIDRVVICRCAHLLVISNTPNIKKGQGVLRDNDSVQFNYRLAIEILRSSPRSIQINKINNEKLVNGISLKLAWKSF